MMQASLGAAAVFGKHPSRGDFLAFGARGSEVLDFDDFVTDNVEWAEARLGSVWASGYAQGSAQAFVFRPREGGGETALVGALAPSVDRSGRRYPLTLALPLDASPAMLGAPELLPLVLEPVWSAASETVVALTANPGADPAQGLHPLTLPTPDPRAARALYDQWTRELPVEELWALLFGGYGQVDPLAVLATVSETAAVCREMERPTTTLALRLPLGLAGGAAVCFWLDWVRSVTRWRTTVPSFFWSHDGEHGAMLLGLGALPRCTLAELWLPSGDRDTVCDVATAPQRLTPTDSATTRGLRARQAELRTVSDLLQLAHTLTP